MDPHSTKFGRGPRELGGAVDLINHYKLWNHHEFFCKRSLPLSISETHYLNNVVGDTEIRKGEGMELDQLFQNACSRERKEHINPFGLDILREAFLMRESAAIDLPASEKGIPINMAKMKRESKGNGRKHKKHRDRDEKERKKHKDRHKHQSDAKIKIQNEQQISGLQHVKEQQDKKRKHDKRQDIFNNGTVQKNVRTPYEHAEGGRVHKFKQ